MAAASDRCAEARQGTTTDFLGVSFSAVDGVGHVYGPRSHEVQDVLVRLDRTIGRLLEHLDAAVGRGNYVLGLSADHGVAEIPEQVGGGRVASKAVAAALERSSSQRSGRGRTSSRRRTRTSISTKWRVSGSRRTRRCAKRRWRRCGPCRASSSPSGAPISRRSRRAPSSDRVFRAAALSHNLGRSGDIIIAPEEHWLMSTAVTTHGTQYAYDQRVPVHLLRGVDPRGTVHRGRHTSRFDADARRRRQGQDRQDRWTGPEAALQ